MTAHEDAVHCPYCGEPTEEILEVADEDSSTGYRGKELMCPACLREERYREAIAEGGLHPLTLLLLGFDPSGC